MIIIVGDSRINGVRKAIGPMEEGMMNPVYLMKPGATMETIMEMLHQFHQTHKQVPEMVVIFGILGDLLARNKDEGPFLRVRKEDLRGSEYPAHGGVLRKRREVEETIQGLWAKVRIIWVLPYPVDLCRFEGIKKKRELSRAEEREANLNSLDFNDYCSGLDGPFQRVEPQNVIPWFPMWKTLYPDSPDSPHGEYFDFMTGIRSGKVVPRLYPDNTTDGLHPTLRLAQGLLRAIVRKYQSLNPSAGGRSPQAFGPAPHGSGSGGTVPRRRKTVNRATQTGSSTPTDSSTQTETSTQLVPESKDQATQTDPERLVHHRRSSIVLMVELPCGHCDVEIEDFGNLLSCRECGERFQERDLEFDLTGTLKMTFRKK